ncbi:hypothetical protein SFRURICE_009043 [Spodoptera frugiperda]|nr:hypothetical protein SFRURICE_009043 [Spodoptera frugiperda]
MDSNQLDVLMNKKGIVDQFYNNVVPLKLTETHHLKRNTEGWGLLTEYSLDSVKINNYKGRVLSCATIRITDRSGQVTCLVKGPDTGLLFGLTATEWKDVESMCSYGDQLFYRYFKNGASKSCSYEQKLFYNFCMTNQKNDVLVAKYRRGVNTRNKFNSDSFLDILELRKCDTSLLDLYVNQLKNSSSLPK